MDRPTVIAHLKELRNQGVEIGVRLTDTTINLNLAYHKLINQHPHRRLSFELLVNLLPRLSLDTIFRLYQKSILVRKVTNNQAFWRRLIERDLKIVPRFDVDLKLHYLRATGVPIAATAILLDRKPEKKVISSFDGHIRFFRGGEIRTELTTFRLPFGEQPKELFLSTTGSLNMITYSGVIYNRLGKRQEIPFWKGGRILSVGSFGRVIAEDGSLYLLGYSLPDYGYHRHPLPGTLPGKVIKIEGRYFLTDQGEIYGFDSDSGAKPKLVRSGVRWFGMIRRDYNLVFINDDESVEYNGKRYPGTAINLGPHGYVNDELKFVSLSGLEIFHIGDFSKKSIIQVFNAQSGSSQIVRYLE